MKHLMLPAVLLVATSVSALAQTATTPAVAPKEANPAAPVQGANSFTEAQAKERIEKAGFSSVSGLKKDANGIWQGTATKSGMPTTVMLDFQGNVVSK
ncbi:PepSY domain-containing protein [Aquabacter cavernae]|uniref:PepSY domain-containing protein n=1 Tax=Aquabacter cavernae TaxID=2496029 RepID=UPI000F8C9770|nr:PepSY domain-containing protein [Aquabacter cavernae]